MTGTRRAFAALAFALHLCATTRADIVDRLDQPAGEIVATKWWNGAAPKPESLRGKVVVLYFSDPTRTTSQAFVPRLAKLVANYRDQPVVFIEIVLADQESVAADYVAGPAKDVYKWLIGWDGDGASQRGYPGTSVPRTYLIGPDGKVVWHMHIQALTNEILDAQVSRCGFYDAKTIPEKARSAARAMLDQRFGDAIVAADKVFVDPYGGSEAKAFCARIKKEVARYYAFQKGVVDALIKDLDWAVAYHKVERLLAAFKGTDHEAEIQKKKDELDANPRVKYIVELQKKLDDMLKDVGRMGPKDLERLVERLKKLIDDNPESAPAKKAQEWIDECERRLKKGGK